MSTSGSNLRAWILIVDDEQPNVILLERILAEAGYTDVISTTSSATVRDLVGDSRPDLILLDLHMPGKDGFGVMEELAASFDPTALPPVLVLTADITRGDIPLVGRITTVADVFDALTHVRPYKPEWRAEQALQEMREQRDKQFDPDALDAFLRVVDTHPADFLIGA